jgi:hypothetical protein
MLQIAPVQTLTHSWSVSMLTTPIQTQFPSALPNVLATVHVPALSHLARVHMQDSADFGTEHANKVEALNGSCINSSVLPRTQVAVP